MFHHSREPPWAQALFVDGRMLKSMHEWVDGWARGAPVDVFDGWMDGSWLRHVDGMLASPDARSRTLVL
jgi:hypothetical protein